MVRTRSRATSLGLQGSRDASNNPYRDQQLAPTPSPVQHVQSMAAAMAELTHQNQELTRDSIHSYLLVCGPNGIPYLINLPRLGHWVKGELYSVSTRGLDRLDELEGTALGHYEWLPIQTQAEAEAYYTHLSFGEELWEKNGREGLSEYTEREASGFVRREDRPKDHSFVDEVRFFLLASSSAPK